MSYMNTGPRTASLQTAISTGTRTGGDGDYHPHYDKGTGTGNGSGGISSSSSQQIRPPGHSRNVSGYLGDIEDSRRGSGTTSFSSSRGETKSFWGGQGDHNHNRNTGSGSGSRRSPFPAEGSRALPRNYAAEYITTQPNVNVNVRGVGVNSNNNSGRNKGQDRERMKDALCEANSKASNGSGILPGGIFHDRGAPRLVQNLLYRGTQSDTSSSLHSSNPLSLSSTPSSPSIGLQGRNRNVNVPPIVPGSGTINSDKRVSDLIWKAENANAEVRRNMSPINNRLQERIDSYTRPSQSWNSVGFSNSELAAGDKRTQQTSYRTALERQVEQKERRIAEEERKSNVHPLGPGYLGSGSSDNANWQASNKRNMNRKQDIPNLQGLRKYDTNPERQQQVPQERVLVARNNLQNSRISPEEHQFQGMRGNTGGNNNAPRQQQAYQDSHHGPRGHSSPYGPQPLHVSYQELRHNPSRVSPRGQRGHGRPQGYPRGHPPQQQQYPYPCPPPYQGPNPYPYIPYCYGTPPPMMMPYPPQQQMAYQQQQAYQHQQRNGQQFQPNGYDETISDEEMLIDEKVEQLERQMGKEDKRSKDKQIPLKPSESILSDLERLRDFVQDKLENSNNVDYDELREAVFGRPNKWRTTHTSLDLKPIKDMINRAELDEQIKLNQKKKHFEQQKEMLEDEKLEHEIQKHYETQKRRDDMAEQRKREWMRMQMRNKKEVTQQYTKAEEEVKRRKFQPAPPTQADRRKPQRKVYSPPAPVEDPERSLARKIRGQGDNGHGHYNDQDGGEYEHEHDHDPWAGGSGDHRGNHITQGDEEDYYSYTQLMDKYYREKPPSPPVPALLPKDSDDTLRGKLQLSKEFSRPRLSPSMIRRSSHHSSSDLRERIQVENSLRNKFSTNSF